MFNRRMGRLPQCNGCLASCLTVLALLAAACGSAVTPTPELPASLLATPTYLDCLGYHFVPVATIDPSALAAISSEQAVSAAWQYEPALKSATIIDTSLGHLGNPANGGASGSAVAGASLVWVVSFSGVESVSSGPPGAPHHTANEYSVVIDAQSSQPLVAFPLCNIAPPNPTPSV
jgi:hypothetical protein